MGSPQKGQERSLPTKTKRCLRPSLLRPQAQGARKEGKDVRRARAKEKGVKEDATAVVVHTTRRTAHSEREHLPAETRGSLGSRHHSPGPASKRGAVGSAKERGKERREKEAKVAKQIAKDLVPSKAQNGPMSLGISFHLSEPWGGVA